jgi:hypothetical protein
LEPAEADQRAGKVQEPLQDVGTAFVADRETSVGQQPGQGPLDRPAVAAKPR